MTIQINKNLDNYKEKVVMGLTAKQLIHVIICIGICAGIVAGLHRFIGIMPAALLCFPIVAPIALNGFYEWNGLGFMESMKLRMHYMLHNQPLKYISESESEKVIEDYRLKEEQAQRNAVKKEKKKGGVLLSLIGMKKNKKRR